MADIFLSYAKEDLNRAKVLVKILERRGWSVWWDVKLLVGTRFDLDLAVELREAKCVVVLWSNHSVQSLWVRDEANTGVERRILIPALIDQVDIPLGFRSIETAKLYD